MLNKKYQTQSTAIASYDYTDIEDGTGVVVLYGGSHQETTTVGYDVSINPFYSETITSRVTATTTSFVKLLDHDYDLDFNTPKSIKGKVKCNVTMGGYTAGANWNGEVYMVLKVRRWDGTTETEIVNTTSSTFVITAGTTEPRSKTVHMRIEVSSVEVFKKGETLRLTLECWGKRTGVENVVIGYAHDPKDRNDFQDGIQIIKDDDTTQLIFYIPFRIDL